MLFDVQWWPEKSASQVFRAGAFSAHIVITVTNVAERIAAIDDE